MTDKSHTRESVYAIIDSERNYQEHLWGDTSEGGLPGNGKRSVDAYAAYLARYSNVLLEVVDTSDDDIAKMAVIRKIAALCVAAMEHHTTPMRYYEDGKN